MKRTSLFLDEKLLKILKRTAAQNGVSVAALVREAVSRYLAAPTPEPSVPSIAGRFSSGSSDTSANTDAHLWQDPHA
jgi:hypothetical protein